MTTHELFISLLPSVTNALICANDKEIGFYSDNFINGFASPLTEDAIAITSELTRAATDHLRAIPNESIR